MRIVGWESVAHLVEREHYQFKAVLNEQGAIFFAVAGEHREHSAPGIRYDDDDARGNALAAMISRGRVEIRRQAVFPPERVRRIVASLMHQEPGAALAGASVVYAGKRLA